MENRIKRFLEIKGISSSELADSIGVQRSNISHVLNGRNKPSFQFIEKLLQTYPELNAKWLLLGEGNMIDGISKPRSLFDTLTDVNPKLENTKQIDLPIDEIPFVQPQLNKSIDQTIQKNDLDNLLIDSKSINRTSEKSIEKIIVFFSDQTFKVHYPSL
jgi:transcriptional regulator with XRE-family HTH domain